MTLAPKKISALSVADPASSSDYIPIVQGGTTKKMAARKVPRVVSENPYTMVLTDADGYIRQVDPDSVATPTSFVIPANADVPCPPGTTIIIEAKGSNGGGITGSVGVTINPSDPVYILFQHGIAVATKVDTDEWTVAGGFTPGL